MRVRSSTPAAAARSQSTPRQVIIVKCSIMLAPLVLPLIFKRRVLHA